MRQLLSLYLPVLFPSWRFFKEVLPVAEVEVWAEDRWVDALPRVGRLTWRGALVRLVWNPAWNNALFVVSCADRVVTDPSDHGARELRRRIAWHHGAEARFRIVIREQVGGVQVTTIPFQSDADHGV